MHICKELKHLYANSQNIQQQTSSLARYDGYIYHSGWCWEVQTHTQVWSNRVLGNWLPTFTTSFLHRWYKLFHITFTKHLKFHKSTTISRFQDYLVMFVTENGTLHYLLCMMSTDDWLQNIANNSCYCFFAFIEFYTRWMGKEVLEPLYHISSWNGMHITGYEANQRLYK